MNMIMEQQWHYTDRAKKRHNLNYFDIQMTVHCDIFL